LSFSSDETYYALKPYNKAEFAEAIDKLPTRPSGPTLLNNAFKKLNNAMANIEGRTAVFLFTDGSYTRSKDQHTPLSLAREMARNNDICFYVISSAKGEAEKRLIASVASINECSRVIPFKDLFGRPEYTIGALFVVQARLVPTFETRERVVGVKTENILFDSAQTDIKPEFYAELRKLGEFLEENPQAYAVLSGFSDSTGDETYNMGLSRRRAESVAGYLYENFNVSSGQAVPLWYGAASPVGSNDTGEGRRQNRRVECYISGL
jgi:OOP family OmpA-OmpF porin